MIRNLARRMLRGEEWPCRSLQAFSAAGRAGFEKKKLNFSLDNFFFIDYGRASKVARYYMGVNPKLFFLSIHPI